MFAKTAIVEILVAFTRKIRLRLAEAVNKNDAGSPVGTLMLVLHFRPLALLPEPARVEPTRFGVAIG